MTAVARRPFGVTLLVVLYDINALFGLFGGLMLALTSAFVSINTYYWLYGMRLSAAGVATTLWSLAVLIVSHALWKGRNWARLTFKGLLMLGLWPHVQALMSVASGMTASTALVSLLMVAVNLLFLLILAGRPAREFCAR